MAIKVHYISILLANMDIIKSYERNQWKGAKDKLVIKLLTMDFLKICDKLIYIELLNYTEHLEIAREVVLKDGLDMKARGVLFWDKIVNKLCAQHGISWNLIVGLQLGAIKMLTMDFLMTEV